MRSTSRAIGDEGFSCRRSTESISRTAKWEATSGDIDLTTRRQLGLACASGRTGAGLPGPSARLALVGSHPTPTVRLRAVGERRLLAPGRIPDTTRLRQRAQLDAPGQRLLVAHTGDVGSIRAGRAGRRTGRPAGAPG